MGILNEQSLAETVEAADHAILMGEKISQRQRPAQHSNLIC
ncbi:MAG: hypothetical protein ACLFVU_06670 [Phycisphaerae bacterium]